MLIAPSWGGMINGLLTLRGAYDRVRESPVLKFMVVGVTAYGMSTFEGPVLSLKTVNAIAHYTDYIIAHVHMGALAWNGGLTFAILYYIIPRIYGVPLFSKRLANIHFWFATLGILFYAIPMYVGGIMQSLMWKEFTEEGLLRYPNFLETVTQIMPMYILRAVGGTLYIVGSIFAVVNLWKTAKSGTLLATEEDQAPAMDKTAEVRPSVTKRAFHRWLEGKPALFTVLVVVAILIGGIVEFIPTAMVDSNVPKIDSVKPYTPLELAGRDIYISDGCNNCHSQMIRPFRSETARYGDYSKAGEFVYDHPFLWGSKRTGPDLHRIGAKYPDSWHYLHMRDPQSTSPGSIMPSYPWMYTRDTNFDILPAKIGALQTLNVPYAYAEDDPAIIQDAKAQAEQIAAALRAQGFSDADANKQIIAMIAYLQRMGTDIKNASTVPLK
jgi:cytochrome c oxidase cbb3-type subunit I/II